MAAVTLLNCGCFSFVTEHTELVFSSRLHKEVRAFAAYISPTPEEHEVRGMIVTIITRTIQRAWPDARISPFGSYETKLYLPLGYVHGHLGTVITH